MAGSCEHGNEVSGSIEGGGMYWLAEWLSASQEWFCSMELVTVCVTNLGTRERQCNPIIWLPYGIVMQSHRELHSVGSPTASWNSSVFRWHQSLYTRRYGLSWTPPPYNFQFIVLSTESDCCTVKRWLEAKHDLRCGDIRMKEWSRFPHSFNCIGKILEWRRGTTPGLGQRPWEKSRNIGIIMLYVKVKLSVCF
jgi:hypothetical protein